ncbi:MAG: HAD family hydrolase [Wenzhouxiangella sp.]|nr:MAG: HAD family hydrolase [Wenzhouxiangella sp.]
MAEFWPARRLARKPNEGPILVDKNGNSSAWRCWPAKDQVIVTIFDIDGTICDSGEVEGDCFAKAIEVTTGKTLATLDWTKYPEPTSAGIVRDLLDGDPQAQRKASAIKKTFLGLLSDARRRYPEEFRPLAGAIPFIQRLERERIARVAIATGCFEEEARFKLACCGIDMDDFPYATSSDTPRRRDILALAATRAGASLRDAIYFADAPWDLAVSQALAVPMVGVGRRIEELTASGLDYTFADYQDQDGILNSLTSIGAH